MLSHLRQLRGRREGLAVRCVQNDDVLVRNSPCCREEARFRRLCPAMRRTTQAEKAEQSQCYQAQSA